MQVVSKGSLNQRLGGGGGGRRGETLCYNKLMQNGHDKTSNVEGGSGGSGRQRRRAFARWLRFASSLDLEPVRGAGPRRHGSGLLDDALELVHHLRRDLVPKQAAGVDLGGGLALVLLAHGGEGCGEVAAVRRLGRRERVAEVVASNAVAGASEVKGRHAVVLGRGDGEQLLVLLLLCGSSKL